MTNEYEGLNTDMLYRLQECNSELKEYEVSINMIIDNIEGSKGTATALTLIKIMMENEIIRNDKLINEVKEKKELPF